MSALYESLLRIALDEVLPTPCYLSDVEEWCRQRGQSSSILEALKSVVVDMAGDEIVVSYGPDPSAEDCVVGLLLPYVPMTLKEIRPLFRSHFPGATFQQSSLMVGLELDPRVVRLPGDRYGLREEVETEEPPKEKTIKQAEVPKAAPVNALDLSDISLAALAFNSRTLRALVRHKLYSVSDVFEYLDMQSAPLEDFRRPHWQDLFSTLRALIPVGHPARLRLQQFEKRPTAGQPTLAKPLPSNESAEVTDSEFRRMLEDTPDGGMLRLGPCLVRIDRPIAIFQSITIRGDGPECTRILYRGLAPDKGGILHFSGGGFRRLIGLSVGFESAREDTTENDEGFAVSVADGEIECLECRFHGAGNVGLEVNGDTVGKVSNCEFDHNMYGIWADDQSNVNFVNNRLHHNSDDGFVLAGETKSRVVRCESFENEGCGVFVFRDAQPTLEKNILSANVCGLYYGDDSGGTASENECLNNKAEGIRVLDQAKPSLLNNRCTGNGSAGISFAGSSEGKASSNSCKNNAEGIRVLEDARPLLSENLCEWNREDVRAFATPKNFKD